MQFAVIKTGGKQYKVSPGQKIKIEKIDAPAGKSVVFDDVLLIADGRGSKTRTDADKEARNNAEIKVGQPKVSGAKVEGKILEQGRADKIIIFKYKAKKRYSVKRGHRQPYSLVEITKIIS